MCSCLASYPSLALLREKLERPGRSVDVIGCREARGIGTGLVAVLLSYCRDLTLNTEQYRSLMLKTTELRKSLKLVRLSITSGNSRVFLAQVTSLYILSSTPIALSLTLHFLSRCSAVQSDDQPRPQALLGMSLEQLFLFSGAKSVSLRARARMGSNALMQPRPKQHPITSTDGPCLPDWKAWVQGYCCLSV